ncbi:MAG: polysaccharide biosynthesis tyrosine autokinase [Deltaproteobacteria bacterium]|nr:polysaccharide biosynthesis tyrosine autokinase [Deltaproteobacteria bacterium]MBW1719951.1 polysaccharide biosynthesis tyrosine autokinase [Deltaproteobacteria bacterium]MBW1937199.1 polysaccharide biosynthesis tyrosine autokinase [Deltaproteobacteria bacterium]MBW1964803.1 polysaccharide biosynthesis tyrosine autokinase [Deltaproteobacteria bacterium]
MGKIADALDKARKETARKKGLLRPLCEIGSREQGQARIQPEGSTKPVHQDTTTSKTDIQTGEGAGFVSKALQGPVDPRLVVFHDPESPAAEHFKVLRSQILYPEDGKNRRVILVTSAMEQAGKTMVACNLAVSIAQSVDPYALLIDADIRRASVHGMLGLEPREGLSEYLQRNETLSKYLIRTPMLKLTVLPAGHSVRNPAELLTSAKMRHLFEEARERYPDRFIIVDSPPVNLVAETLRLSQNVDAVVFVVRYGYSNQDLIEEAVAKLGEDKILGIVFNCFEIPSGKYSYYKKRYPYYRSNEQT